MRKSFIRAIREIRGQNVRGCEETASCQSGDKLYRNRIDLNSYDGAFAGAIRTALLPRYVT
jgi:hypothetical protein